MSRGFEVELGGDAAAGRIGEQAKVGDVER
jgi:hypothetical protein